MVMIGGCRRTAWFDSVTEESTDRESARDKVGDTIREKKDDSITYDLGAIAGNITND
jgi:hypothetical protein